jgi:hypothetical protein
LCEVETKVVEVISVGTSGFFQKSLDASSAQSISTFSNIGIGRVEFVAIRDYIFEEILWMAAVVVIATVWASIMR